MVTSPADGSSLSTQSWNDAYRVGGSKCAGCCGTTVGFFTLIRSRGSFRAVGDVGGCVSAPSLSDSSDSSFADAETSAESSYTLRRVWRGLEPLTREERVFELTELRDRVRGFCGVVVVELLLLLFRETLEPVFRTDDCFGDSVVPFGAAFALRAAVLVGVETDDSVEVAGKDERIDPDRSRYSDRVCRLSDGGCSSRGSALTLVDLRRPFS